MTIEQARLLIRISNQVKDENDRKALLSLADELLAITNTSKQCVVKSIFPLSIFRKYKGKMYEAKLLKGWRVELNGKVYNTPSAAAVHISEHPENGWRMWKYFDETSNSERMIDTLR